MPEEHDLRVDATGAVHPLGRRASQEQRARAGEWRLLSSPVDVMLALRPGGTSRPLKMAGEVRAPFALCDVVTVISQAAWTAELSVYEERAPAAVVRTIQFDRGNVVTATSSAAGERLGEILWRFGAITRDQLDEVLGAAERTGKRVGEAALDLEFVEPEDIFLMVGRQIEEVFYGALHVGRGAYFVFDGMDEARMGGRHRLSASQLVMEAARRADELRFFREKIPSDAWVPTPLTPSGRKPLPELAEVLAHCDGRRSIAEIGRRIGQLEFDVTRAVFQLAAAAFVYVAPPRVAGPTAIADMFNRALLEIHRACDVASRGAELRTALEHFVASTGTFVPLFAYAGPLRDGTLSPEGIERNVAAIAGEDPDAWLVQQLFEYVGFALFHAGSLLSRPEEAALNARVASMLKPMRQHSEAAPPPSLRTPSTAPASYRRGSMEKR
ncbi:MAG TPA: DUF4388 domain-containing protein [Polyangiaceae bacterium]